MRGWKHCFVVLTASSDSWSFSSFVAYRLSDHCSANLTTKCNGFYVYVEREIGHQPFQPTILLFHRPQLAEFAHAQMRVLLFPGVEGGLADAELPTEVTNRGPTLGLPDSIADLLLSSKTTEAAILLSF